VVVSKIWDCAPQGGSLSGLHCCLVSGACFHGAPPRARWCWGSRPATFEFVCFDPGCFNGVVVGSPLIESLQISRLRTKNLLSAEIETTTQIIACTWE
jgi:hypothetical protein